MSHLQVITQMVCVDKKNKNKELKICMDPGDLNKNTKREHYQIPKREGIASANGRSQIFLKAGCSAGILANQVG